MFAMVGHKILLFCFHCFQEFKQQRFENSYKRDFSRIEINTIHVSTKLHCSLGKKLTEGVTSPDRCIFVVL